MVVGPASCASMIDRACATTPSASGTSCSVGTSRMPSSDAKYNVALIFGTAAGASGAADGVAASGVAVAGAGVFNSRERAVNNTTEATTASTAVATIASHCRAVNDFRLTTAGRHGPSSSRNLNITVERCASEALRHDANASAAALTARVTSSLLETSHSATNVSSPQRSATSAP